MSEFFTVKIRTAAMRRRSFELRTAIIAVAATIPERGAEMAVVKAKAATSWNDRSGETRSKIRKRQIGPYRWRFVAGGASQWLNDGTGIYGPHRTPIVPLRAKFLRFQIGSQLFFRRSVKGQKATHFVDKAREDAEAFVYTDALHQISGIISEFNR